MIENQDWYCGFECEFNGHPKDAFKHFISAAKDGYIPAIRHLGEYYYEGSVVPKDNKMAYDCYLYAADQGDVFAQYAVAIMYHEGIGTERNLEAYMYWLNKAASQHHARAVYYLGKAYLNGDGVQADQQQGLKLIQQAAALNLPEAQCLLYLEDSSQVQLLKSSAKAGYPLGQMELAIHYMEKQDTSAAIHWYTLAADKILEARLSLATYYLNDNGPIPQDLTKAVLYLEGYLYPKKGDFSVVGDSTELRAFALEGLAYAYRSLGQDAEALGLAKQYAMEHNITLDEVLNDWVDKTYN